MSGLPAPTVQWTWRGLPLEEVEGREGKGKKTWYDEKTGRVVLLIEDLGPGDEGDYQCRADNPYGDSTCTITVSNIFIIIIHCNPHRLQISPETVSKKKVVLPKGSCRMKLKACHIESDDYADYASTMGL